MVFNYDVIKKLLIAFSIYSVIFFFEIYDTMYCGVNMSKYNFLTFMISNKSKLCYETKWVVIQLYKIFSNYVIHTTITIIQNMSLYLCDF